MASPQPRLVAGRSFKSFTYMRVARVLGPLLVAIASIPASIAAPLRALEDGGPQPKPSDDPGLWVYLGTALILVLLGGVFAGLTIALMGQDEIYLQVIATSGEGTERKNARKVLNLLKRGKHWVLVTLLLGNVITNETLPIVLDRSLGGGWPAVLGSTVLIVIFGEIAPQSICVRYGLPIGAFMAPFVFVLMYLLSPVAWPTAKLLDYLLGEDHGTTYKKAGLKTLVTLHKTLGESPTERLNQDEVTIISAVLDLKDKPVGNIMTPISDVFTLSLDTVLDEAMMDKILAEGYSRIPIYAVNNPRDFVGMLLVKMLITYDPEDGLHVRDFQLATLPETKRETSCLDIINFFQEGKSHMVLVSDYPGEPRGAVGVVTLEDVIEELIGEEIIDESDVYLDVHRAIRRLKPAPFTRIRRAEKGEFVTDPDPQAPDSELEGYLDSERRSRAGSRTGSMSHDAQGSRNASFSELGRSPPGKAVFVRRRSSGGEQVPVRSDNPEMRQHLKAHLGPSNLASRPKTTRIGTVTIKPGLGQLRTLPETQQSPVDGRLPIGRTQSRNAEEPTETTSLLSAGHGAKDGAHYVDYGVLSPSSTAKIKDTPLISNMESNNSFFAKRDTAHSPLRQSETHDDPTSPRSEPSTSSVHSTSKASSPKRDNVATPPKMVLDLTPSKEDLTKLEEESSREAEQHDKEDPSTNGKRPASRASTSTIGSLHSIDSHEGRSKRRLGARSGSITEHTIEVGGVKKIVLEATSSSDEQDENVEAKQEPAESSKAKTDGAVDGDKLKKKRKKKRGGKNKKKANAGSGEESQPMLRNNS